MPGDQGAKPGADLAETALRRAVAHLLRAGHDAGHLRLPDPSDPERDCGFVVLGMGKLGARELNYSSDIDLIVLYDPLGPLLADTSEAATFFVRLTRRLVQIMQDVTEDGYVFRTDLRLRPDPRATQVAISLVDGSRPSALR